MASPRIEFDHVSPLRNALDNLLMSAYAAHVRDPQNTLRLLGAAIDQLQRLAPGESPPIIAGFSRKQPASFDDNRPGREVASYGGADDDDRPYSL